MDIVISHPNFNLWHQDKCKFAMKFIPLLTTSNLLPLEVVQNCQLCQICVLRGNSNVTCACACVGQSSFFHIKT